MVSLNLFFFTVNNVEPSQQMNVHNKNAKKNEYRNISTKKEEIIDIKI